MIKLFKNKKVSIFVLFLVLFFYQCLLTKPVKYVITGGPGVGKTALVNVLASRGYQAVQEVAALLIKEELDKGNEHPTKNRDEFQTNVMNKQIELEDKLDNDKVAFLDRGIIDGIAYYRFDKIEPPKELVENAKKREYKLVFILDFLEDFYETNEIRLESVEIAHKIHNLIKEEYQNFGYKLIEVPPVNVQERVEFVITHLQ